MNKLPERLLRGVARIGTNPDDSDDLRLQKDLLTLGSIMFIMAGILQRVIYTIQAYQGRSATAPSPETL